MYIQNLKKKKFKSIPAHNGQGLIHMKFFHQEFQNFREVDDLPIPDESFIKSSWNFIAYAELPIGSTIGYHKHTNNDEIYFILSGEATITVDQEEQIIKKGDIILTRTGSSHGIKNVKNKLKFYAIEILQKDLNK